VESDISIGMLSSPGPRPENQDAVGARLPGGPLRRNKGMAFAIADGASVAEAGRIAAESCVKNFLGDYFATPESWSVKRSGGAVLDALNRWLLGQGLAFWRYPQRGCVSTFTGCVLHGRNLHIFHVGDTRLYRFAKVRWSGSPATTAQSYPTASLYSPAPWALITVSTSTIR
jgi:serine/threonine protein phosphatase PrpC